MSPANASTGVPSKLNDELARAVDPLAGLRRQPHQRRRPGRRSARAARPAAPRSCACRARRGTRARSRRGGTTTRAARRRRCRGSRRSRSARAASGRAPGRDVTSPCVAELVDVARPAVRALEQERHYPVIRNSILYMCNTNADGADAVNRRGARVGSAARALAILDLLAESGAARDERDRAPRRARRRAPSRASSARSSRRASSSTTPRPAATASASTSSHLANLGARAARRPRASPVRTSRRSSPRPARRRRSRCPAEPDADHRRLRARAALRPGRHAARPAVGRPRDRGRQGDARVHRRAVPAGRSRAYTDADDHRPGRARARSSSGSARRGWAEAYEEREPELNAIAAPGLVGGEASSPRSSPSRARSRASAARSRGKALPLLLRSMRPRSRRALGVQYEPLTPGIQLVPASGTRAIAAASTVSATRSSGSRLCTCDLPHARASVCASSVSTRR